MKKQELPKWLEPLINPKIAARLRTCVKLAQVRQNLPIIRFCPLFPLRAFFPIGQELFDALIG